MIPQEVINYLNETKPYVMKLLKRRIANAFTLEEVQIDVSGYSENFKRRILSAAKTLAKFTAMYEYAIEVLQTKKRYSVSEVRLALLCSLVIIDNVKFPLVINGRTLSVKKYETSIGLTRTIYTLSDGTNNGKTLSVISSQLIAKLRKFKDVKEKILERKAFKLNKREYKVIKERADEILKRIVQNS